MADSVYRSLADRSLALDALIETGNPFTDDKIDVRNSCLVRVSTISVVNANKRETTLFLLDLLK